MVSFFNHAVSLQVTEKCMSRLQVIRIVGRSIRQHVLAGHRYASTSRKIGTQLAQAGCVTDPTTGAITPSIHLSSTFERDEDLTYSRGFDYARHSNPTRAALEQAMAAVEGGAQGHAFASGMAAATSILLALPKCYAVLPDDLYHGVYVAADSIFKPWGCQYNKVDMTHLEGVERALQTAAKTDAPYVVLWLETPSNPSVKVTDIAAAVKIARNVIDPDRLFIVCDSTWSTPVLTKPLDLGVDAVIHSMTKYISGHSDLVAGMLVTADTEAGDRLHKKIYGIQGEIGGNCAPFDAWLAMRGMRSLKPRMKQHCESAFQVAEFLQSHPAIDTILYPGLPSHPQHEIAKKQMNGGFGGMMSVLVKGDANTAKAVVQNMKLFKKATSLGGTESLIEHRRSIEPETSPTPENLLRLSIGLEDVEDLMADLDQSLTAAVKI